MNGARSRLKNCGILAIGFGNLMRMVTHLDISSDNIETTIANLKEIMS